MKQFLILALISATAFAAVVPPTPVVKPTPVVVPTPETVVEHHDNKDVVHKPSVVTHVPHVGTKVPHVDHPHIVNDVVHTTRPVIDEMKPTSVPVPPHHHVHVSVSHHHADGHKHVAHNVVAMTPQHIVDKVNKVEQHVQSVMQQVHQHIPQVINHQIAEKQKHKQQTHGVPQTMHGDKVVGDVHSHPHPVVQVPVVTVKTTAM